MKKFAFPKGILLVSAFMLILFSCDANATIFKLYKVTTKVERCECNDPELTPPPIEQGLSVYRFTHNRQFQPVCPNSVFYMWEFYASQEFLQAQYITDIMLEDIWIDDHSDGHCSVWCTGNASLISTNSPADIDIPEHYEIEINIALPPDFTDFLGHVSMETFIYDHPWPIITMLWFDDPALRKKYIIQSIYDILPDTDKGMDPVEFCTGKSIQNITDIKLPGNTMDINFTRLY